MHGHLGNYAEGGTIDGVFGYVRMGDSNKF